MNNGLKTKGTRDVELEKALTVIKACLQSDDPEIVEDVRGHLCALAESFKQKYSLVILNTLLKGEPAQGATNLLEQITEPPPLPALQLAQLFQEAKDAKGFSTDRLAEAAGVSNNSVLSVLKTVCDQGRNRPLHRILRDGKRANNAEVWRGIVDKIGTALELDPGQYTDLFTQLVEA